jgi:Protein of unknown function (DUF3592)
MTWEIMDQKKLILCMLGVGIGVFAAGALAMVGFYRDASFNELAIIEILGGVGIALYAGLRGARERRWRRREESWARIEATIIESEVVEAFVWGGGTTTYYAPKVRYRFSIDGTLHEGKRVQIDAGSNTSQSDVQEWVARYPVGATVLAYCDPKDPSLSVLELEDDGIDLVTAGLASLPVFALFAAGFALMGRYMP